jgi:insertion element IS1 protein InsB
LAICRDSKKIIAYQLGCRGIKTGKKLWEKIKDIPCRRYCSDYWEAYRAFIPADKHIASKKETYTIESYNDLFRHYLARFHRSVMHSFSLSVYKNQDRYLPTEKFL